MKTTYKTSRDLNGNKTLIISPNNGHRGFSIQTNGNLPRTHRDGVTDDTPAEVLAYVTDHGTDHRRVALGLPAAPSKGKFYIQRRGNGQLETVDQFDTRKEARENLKEYALADRSAVYYISRRPCRDWLWMLLHRRASYSGEPEESNRRSPRLAFNTGEHDSRGC